jgi:predicted LPLAT superfamily acyltransferase
LVDRAVLGILGPDQFDIRLEGKEALLRTLAKGEGLLLVTAHVGSWQVAMSALDFIKVKVNLLVHRDQGDVDRHYFEHGEQENPFRIIDPADFVGATIDMMSALNRGEVLCVMGDRMFGSEKNAITVDFLGGKVKFPKSALRLAQACGSPAVFFFSQKTGPSSYYLTVDDVIEWDDTRSDGQEELREAVEKFARSLDRYVARNPWQFFNFFDMWEDQENCSPGGNPASGEEAANP